MEYDVIVSDINSLSDLIQKVNAAIQEGWRPQGGVGVSIEKSKGLECAFYYQAMVRDQNGNSK